MKLDAFFKPDSIAVIGASREPEKVGNRVFRNLIDSGFKGGLYPINPKADEILGFKCYKSIAEAPDRIDLAVIAVPAKLVPMVAEECGAKGVKGIIIISAGFSETGREGTALERELLAICRRYNMRMQGPNCLGIVNTQSSMNASFASASPSPGNIAFVSQSGALGSVILNCALQNEMGFTSFISLGNEADLNAADFIEALGEDEQTRVVGLYIEGVKDGERFIQTAEKVTKKKPIVALKAGTTDVGIRAVSSHTGSLAGSDTAFTSAFKKAGIIRANSFEELFTLVQAFEAQPVPRGKNVLIVTNGGGPGILVADACEKMGLDLPLLEHEIRENLRQVLPPHASLNNPVDVLGDADENRYRLALEAGLKSQGIEGIIVIVTPQAMTPAEKIADVVVEIQKSSEKPILGAFMGFDDDSATAKLLRSGKVPNFPFPESSAYALRIMYDYASLLKVPSEETQVFSKADDDKVRTVISKVHREERLSLTIEESIALTEAYGISMPNAAVAGSREAAGEIANKVGYPVVMKVVSPEVLHKTDVGGVVLNVRTREEVERNYDRIMSKLHSSLPDAKILGMLIQKMAPQGKEVIVGAVRDIQFGPLLMFGLGGIYVNFLRDVSYRLAPITRSEARKMVEETKAYTLLRGVRGEPPSDIESVIDVIVKISQLMCKFKDIIEMEINPLFVYEEGKGCLAVDVRTTIR